MTSTRASGKSSRSSCWGRRPRVSRRNKESGASAPACSVAPQATARTTLLDPADCDNGDNGTRLFLTGELGMSSLRELRRGDRRGRSCSYRESPPSQRRASDTGGPSCARHLAGGRRPGRRGTRKGGRAAEACAPRQPAAVPGRPEHRASRSRRYRTEVWSFGSGPSASQVCKRSANERCGTGRHRPGCARGVEPRNRLYAARHGIGRHGPTRLPKKRWI